MNTETRAETTAKTTRDFCAKYGILITAEYGGKHEEPQGKDRPGWKHFLWECTLTRRETKAGALTQTFKMGEAHIECKPAMPANYNRNSVAAKEWIAKYGRPTPPKAEDIIDSMIMDSSAMEQTFEDWASEFGYDTDSRTAEKTFHACQDCGARLLKFLGRELFDDLRNNYERL